MNLRVSKVEGYWIVIISIDDRYVFFPLRSMIVHRRNRRNYSIFFLFLRFQ